jgi:hypothetical protein
MAHGFLYQDGTITVIDAPNAAFPYGTYSIPDINNLGQMIVNVYTGASGFKPSLGTPMTTPEPASLLLICVGLACVRLLNQSRAH